MRPYLSRGWNTLMFLPWPRETTRCLSLHTERGSTTPRFDQTNTDAFESYEWFPVCHYFSLVFLQVTFKNDVTGEYLFYLVTFKTTAPGVLSSIELVTTVRRTVSSTVEVENPLNTTTCLTTECKCADISAPPQHTVPGQSKVNMDFYFFHTVKNTAVYTQTFPTLCSFSLGFPELRVPASASRRVYSAADSV